MDENFRIRKPSKSYQVYNILSKKESRNSTTSIVESEPSILVSIYNNTNVKRANRLSTISKEESFEMGNAWMKPKTHEDNIFSERSLTLNSCSTNNFSNFKEANQSLNMSLQSSGHIKSRTSFISSPFQTESDNYQQSSPKKISKTERTANSGGSVFDFGDLARKYTLGADHEKKDASGAKTSQ